MAGRSLENLRKRYNTSASAGAPGPAGKPGRPGPGPGHGPGRGMPGAKPKDAKKTIGRIFSYISQYKARLVAVVVCLLLNTGATLAGGYLLRPILNHVAEAGISAAERISYLISMLIVLFFAYMVAVISSFLQYRLMVEVSQSAVQRIRRELFSKLQKLPLK